MSDSDWTSGWKVILIMSSLFTAFSPVLEELASGHGALVFDFDLPDDEEFEEVDVSRDPSLSKYPDLKDMERIVEFYFSTDPKVKKTFDQVQHSYRRLNSAKEIHRYASHSTGSVISRLLLICRIREYLNHGGTVYAKFRAINERVLEEFTSAADEGLEIHDRDIEEWGLVAAENLKLPSFVAGHHWISHFKRRNKIVSRKATGIVGRKHRLNAAGMKHSIDEFMEEVKPMVAKLPREKVLYLSDSNNILTLAID
jgi:hypothetical protein